MASLLVVGSIAAIGGYMLFQMNSETEYDYDAYFASNKIKLVMPPEGPGILDSFIDSVANNWIVSGIANMFKRAGQWATGKAGEFAGDIITGWLTEFFSSPTTIAVLVALLLGAIVAGILISRL